MKFAPFAELIIPFPSDFAYKSLIKCYPNLFVHLFQMNDLFFSQDYGKAQEAQRQNSKLWKP